MFARLKKAALICNTIFRARRMFIGIEFPPRSPCSAGQPGSRGGVIQYSKSFPSKNKTDIAGVGRLDGIYMRRFHDGITYIRRVRTIALG